MFTQTSLYGTINVLSIAIEWYISIYQNSPLSYDIVSFEWKIIFQALQ